MSLTTLSAAGVCRELTFSGVMTSHNLSKQPKTAYSQETPHKTYFYIT